MADLDRDLSEIKVVLMDLDGIVCAPGTIKEFFRQLVDEALTEVLSKPLRPHLFSRCLDDFPAEHRRTSDSILQHVRSRLDDKPEPDYIEQLFRCIFSSRRPSHDLSKEYFYPDVATNIQNWNLANIVVITLSPEMERAQAHFMRHVVFDHLRGGKRRNFGRKNFWTYHSATSMGPMDDPSSYLKIVTETGRDEDLHVPEWEASEYLFLGRRVNEVNAAKQAGMKTILVERLGANGGLPQGTEQTHWVVRDFHDIPLRLP